MTVDQELAYLRSTLGVTGGTLNDLRMQAYGGTGTQQERASAFWKTGGATGGSLEELERSYLKLKTGRNEPVTLADLRQAWFSNPTPPAPVQTTLATDTFASWAKWKILNGTAAQFTATGNVGKIVPPATGYATSRAIFNTLASQGDMVISLELQFGTGEHYVDVGVHAQDAAGLANPRGYYASFYPGGDPAYTMLSSDGQYTAQEQQYPFTYVAAHWYGMKIRSKGNQTAMKVWDITAGATERFGYDLWMIDTPYPAGYVSLGVTSGGANLGQLLVRNLAVKTVVDEPGDTTPSPATLPAAGTVTSSNHTWTRTFGTDFPTDVAEGGFRTAYPAMGSYTEEQGDTATAVTGGKYSTNKVAAVVGGVLTVKQRVIGGVPYSAAILPDNYAPHTYARVQFRARTTDTGGVGGFKFVPLWWPSSNDWADGEIDWPEADNGQIPYPASASYPATYVNGNTDNRRFFPETKVPAPAATSGWHVYTVDWAPDGISFYQDGVIVARVTNPAGIPTKPMRFTLQAETWIQSGVVPTGGAGTVEVDWVAIYDLTA